VKTYPNIDRYWSLAAVFILPVAVFFAEVATRGFWEDYEIVRAVLSATCIALLVHSWLIQRKHTKSQWRLAFWTLLLSLVALGPVWLGLNVIRYYAHPMNWNKWELWQAICLWQYRIELTAQVLAVVVLLWATVDLVCWLAKRVRAVDKVRGSRVF
jgi:hypothetical protein